MLHTYTRSHSCACMHTYAHMDINAHPAHTIITPSPHIHTYAHMDINARGNILVIAGDILVMAHGHKCARIHTINMFIHACAHALRHMCGNILVMAPY